MLELRWIARTDGHGRTVDVQFADDGTATDFQFRSERLLRALPQTKQPDQNILFRVLVRNERLPTAVREIIPPDQFGLKIEGRIFSNSLSIYALC